MSQDPHLPPGSPPQPPGYSPGSHPLVAAPMDPLGPARRASTLMYVLGALGIACGLCVGAVFRMPLEQMAAQQGRALPQLPQGVTYAQLAGVATVFGVIAVVVSLVLLIVATYVRRGSSTAILIGMALTAVLLVVFVLQTGRALQDRQAGEILFSLVPLVAFGMLMAFLRQARRAGAYLRQAQAAYQAQYWQYLQQQQAYQSGGYNQSTYNAPPTGPAQPGATQTGWQWVAPPPPPPTQPPAEGGSDASNPK
jgi:hypothetical protein